MGLPKLNKKYVDKSVERYNQKMKEGGQSLTDTAFRVSDNIKTEYDMWVWIYQEIANIRMEVSRVATMVRVNNYTSPNFLVPYHSHIYSLLIPMSVVIDTNTWKKIEREWLRCKQEINNYVILKQNIPNKKIPFKLIRDLDNLYRIALLVAQKAGLGMRVTVNENVEDAIEKAITGD